ncbi:uncharacterized protein [Penaeus vannamei]|uniref:uncharacterized protein n=1 Tax=Penaeus vannamei TaxID=6689 RepID=UPI00387F958B
MPLWTEPLPCSPVGGLWGSAGVGNWSADSQEFRAASCSQDSLPDLEEPTVDARPRNRYRDQVTPRKVNPDQERPDVVLLNSTAITNGYRIRHYGYTSRQTGDGLYMGSCILIKSTITFEFITLPFTHPDFMAVRIFTPQGPIILSTAYIRPSTNLPLADFNRLFNYTNLPVFFARDINASHHALHHKSTNSHEKRSFRYQQADWESFKSKLSEVNFQFNLDGLDSQTIDGHWNFIFAHIVSTMLSTIPRSQRHVIDSLDTDRQNHWHNLVKNVESNRVRNPREFWQKIRQLKGSNFPPFSHLVQNNVNVSNPVDVIKVSEEHWAKVFYPHPPHPLFTQRIQDIDTWSHENRVETIPEPIIRMDRLDDTCELTAPISCEEVKQLIMKSPRKAPGSSQIGRDALIHFPDNLLQALTHLYNASLASGYFPSCFKTALVALIPKPHKDLTDPKSYRPISLLETLGKTFERIINTRLRWYLEDHNLLSQKQFGFRSHHSTQDALNIITNYVHNNKDRRLMTVLVTKDVERAFDTVWHAGLKYKLCTKFNFPPLIKKLLCNFLDDRKLK